MESEGLFEGDILINNEEISTRAVKPGFHWPRKKMFYKIGEEFSSQEVNKIKRAMQATQYYSQYFPTLLCLNLSIICESDKVLRAIFKMKNTPKNLIRLTVFQMNYFIQYSCRH